MITGVRDLTARRVVTSFSPAPLNDLLFTTRGDWQTGKNDRMRSVTQINVKTTLIAAVCGGLSVRQTIDNTRSRRRQYLGQAHCPAYRQNPDGARFRLAAAAAGRARRSGLVGRS